MAGHVSMRELNLALENTNGVSVSGVPFRMGYVPGFKTGAAFFTSLRYNLLLQPAINSSAMSSNSNTPLLNPTYTQLTDLPTEASTTDLSSPSANPLDDIPPLTSYVTTSDPEKIQALKLIADSVAQQRQTSSRVLIFHPLTIAVWIALLAIASQFLYKTHDDWPIMITTGAGVTMIVMIAIRGATAGYLNEAEKINFGFLKTGKAADEPEDDIIVEKFGDEIIGALVLRLENANGSPRKKGRPSKAKGGKAIVRAWTVRLKYRGKGIGQALLEEAVRVSRETMGKEVEIGFAEKHVNSVRILPSMFNGGMTASERKAAALLERIVDETDPKRRRRSS